MSIDDGRARPLPPWLVSLLGWPSLVLGVAPLVAAPIVASMLGLRPTAPTLVVLRLNGARELVVAVLFLRHPSPLWMWAFLLQDAMDLPVAYQVLVRRLPWSRTRFRSGLTVYVILAAIDVIVTLWSRPRPISRTSATRQRRNYV